MKKTVGKKKKRGGKKKIKEVFFSLFFLLKDEKLLSHSLAWMCSVQEAERIPAGHHSQSSHHLS